MSPENPKTRFEINVKDEHVLSKRKYFSPKHHPEISRFAAFQVRTFILRGFMIFQKIAGSNTSPPLVKTAARVLEAFCKQVG